MKLNICRCTDFRIADKFGDRGCGFYQYGSARPSRSPECCPKGTTAEENRLEPCLSGAVLNRCSTLIRKDGELSCLLPAAAGFNASDRLYDEPVIKPVFFMPVE